MNRREFVATTAASALVAAASPPSPAPPEPRCSPTPARRQEDPRRHRTAGAHPHRRLSVDEGRQLAGGAARPDADQGRRQGAPEAENAYREAMLASTQPLQAAMFEEMKGRIKEDDSLRPRRPTAPGNITSSTAPASSTPATCASSARDRSRTAAGDENFIVARRRTAARLQRPGQGQGLFRGRRPPTTAPTTPCSPMPRTRRARRSTRSTSRTWRPARSCPIRSRAATGDFTFSPDSQWIFWICRDENGRPDKIFRRPARGGETTLVYEEPDDGMFIGVGATSDDAFILIRIGNQETSEARSSRPPTRPPTPVVAGAAPGRRALRRRPLGRPLGHPHQRRRRHRLQDRRGPDRRRRPRPTGATWSPTRPAASSRASALVEGLHRPPGARRRQHAASSSATAPAPSTRSPSTSRPTPCRWPGRPSSTPRRCASSTTRRPRRPRRSTTTWRPASGPCARSRRSRPATTRPTMSSSG